MVEIPGDLVRAIRNNRALAVVGSGFSIPAGGPSWDDLLYELIATGEDRGREKTKLVSAYSAIQAGDFLRAATLIDDAFPKPELERAIVEAIHSRQGAFDLCSDPSKVERLVRRKGRREDRPWRPTPSHRTLLKLNFQAIITTNYDMTLERALGRGDDRITSYSCGSFNRAHANLVWKQFILHLHGSIDEPGDIVFSQYDYSTLFSSDALQFLRSLLSISATLWLGFGHGDPDVAEALKQAGCRIGYSYQVVERADHRLLRLLDERGVTPILVDSYREIPAFLAELAKRTGSQLGSSAQAGTSSTRGGRTATLNAKGRKITDCFLTQPLARLPHDPAKPRISVNGRETLFEPNALFGAWAKTTETGTGRQVAIVAPAGAGKSVLLSSFAGWLRKRLGAETRTDKKLSPIIFFLTPDNLPKSLMEESLLTQVESWAAAAISGYLVFEGSGLLKPWLDAGAVYLLFDGLDEFGARRKGEMDDLMKELTKLARERNARVFLTCREVFWSQQLLDVDRKPWEKVEIRPLEAADLKRFPGLGPFAYDRAGKPKPGVLNHLLKSFVLALRESEGQSEAFASRHGLYERWATFAINRERRRVRSDIQLGTWFSLFQNTGLDLLRNLKSAAPLPELPNGLGVPYDECMAMEILIPTADRTLVKFRHESINDFFVASSLGDSFRQIVQPAAVGTELAGLPLARVDLDFLQTSLYGFLYEELGERYLETLKDRFLDPGVFQYKPAMSKLHRNIVEYAGMTCARSQDLMGFTDWLLGLMGDQLLDAVVRYNAARALERIHPWAPRPYFDYMSDWGDGDWKDVRRQAEKDGLCPWAIRGYRIQQKTGQTVDRKPGKNPPLAVLRRKPKDIGLQRRVSKQLGELILGSLRKLSPESGQISRGRRHGLNWLLINYTHAWVRWYHATDSDVLAKARELAQRRARPEVLENLTTWVDHPKFHVV